MDCQKLKHFKKFNVRYKNYVFCFSKIYVNYSIIYHNPKLLLDIMSTKGSINNKIVS